MSPFSKAKMSPFDFRRGYDRGDHQIELGAGSIRDGNKYSDKVLDIGLLLFGSDDLTDQGYNIPRGDILQAAYVLQPLADLYGELRHPVAGRSYARLWGELSKSDNQIRGDRC